MQEVIVIEEVLDIIQRWKNHIRFLARIRSSNIEKEVVDEWEERIHGTFKAKLKSKL